MTALRRNPAALVSGVARASCVAGVVWAVLLSVGLPARAQEAKPGPEARIVVVGEGSVTAPPDCARITSGATTRAKTVREAADANSKIMTAIMAALTGAGIEQKDIQTSRFTVQPVYASPAPNTEQRLTGFGVSNQVTVTVRALDKLGDILDRLVSAGATDAGGIEFLHADQPKLLDQAREAAVADARRKAELYAHAAGVSLGSVAFMSEETSGAVPMPKVMRAAMPAAPPIAIGEDTLRVSITAGYDIAR